MDDRQAKVEYVLEHYENPRHHGALPNATITQQGGNPACGDIVTIYLKVDDGNRVTDVGFEGEGCTISQAATSMVTEMVMGKTLGEVQELPLEMVLDSLGHEIVATRLRCATLGIATAKEAARRFRREGLARSADIGPGSSGRDFAIRPIEEITSS